MARYDRIAALDAPERGEAFPGWTALRDLEVDERDTELGRRARLRFLALRPVLRLLEHGIDGIDARSYEQQIEAVREELGALPARDEERARLSDYLRRLHERSPLGLATATLDLGRTVENAGHRYAATEFYRAGLALAEAHRLAPERVIALRLLGRALGEFGATDEARRVYRRAAEIATEADDRMQWARATAGLAQLDRRDGDEASAQALLDDVLARGREWDDDFVVATACAGLSELELGRGRLETAIEFGWTAVRRTRDADDQYRGLERLGTAFERLGLLEAAERCYAAIAERSDEPARRLRAIARYAAVAAQNGRTDTFEERRAAVIEEAASSVIDPVAQAEIHLDLGRGSLAAGAPDFARDHLREAIARAERHGRTGLLGRAEEMLSALERAAAGQIDQPPTAAPGETARRIAVEMESLAEALAPAISR